MAVETSGIIGSAGCSHLTDIDHLSSTTDVIIIIIMVIFKCYFSGELIALS